MSLPAGHNELPERFFSSLGLYLLEDKWSTEPPTRCAICDRALESEEMEEEGAIPLMLWRHDGNECLAICWTCVEKRQANSILTEQLVVIRKRR